jgi:transcriptional regulator with XRE-family HTH domain
MKAGKIGKMSISPDMNIAAFRQNLNTLLDSNGMSAYDLSVKVGVAPSTMSRYLSGFRTPDLACAIKLADFFGVSIDWLIGRTASKYDSLSPMVRRFADLYSIATQHDKAVIDTILDSYAGLNKDYLDIRQFITKFCEKGNHNYEHVETILKSLMNIKGLYLRQSHIEMSFRFSADPYDDAALLAFTTQLNKGSVYIAPNRIKIFMLAHDMLPFELNEYLERFRPFIDENAGKSKPYENLTHFYYFDVERIYADLDTFVQIITDFIKDAEEAARSILNDE